MSSFSPKWSEEQQSQEPQSRGVPKWVYLIACIGCALLVSFVVALAVGLREDEPAASDLQPERDKELVKASDFDKARMVFLDRPEIRPVAVASGGYVGSQACAECHEHEHETWHDSYHRTMTQVATPQSIVGDFDDVTLELQGREYHLKRDKELFWVEFDYITTIGRQTHVKKVRREIQLCTGSHHMQIYWMSTGNERETAVFPFMWLIPEKRWIERRAGFIQPPHETDGEQSRFDNSCYESGRWNVGCIHCHTTNGQPRAWERAPDTHVAEFGISCEACHGPGESHILYHDGKADSDPIVHPLGLAHERASEVCGQCHGLLKFPKGGQLEIDLHESGTPYRPGQNLREMRPGSDTDPSMASMFWGDGKIRVTGSEFNGLREAPCFKRGQMSCFSCHRLHQDFNDARPREQWIDDQLKPGMRGDKACLQCHQQYTEEAAMVAHTHHAPSSAGSRCYNCHMPNTTYGLLKVTRAHTVGSPSVTETLSYGRPNACNLCHLDKTLQWTDDNLVKWYDHSPAEISDTDQEVALSIRMALTGDAGQRAIVAWNFGWEPAQQVSGKDWIPPYLAILMDDDPYDAVRFVAQKSLRRIEGYMAVEYEFDAAPTERKESCRLVTRRWQRQLNEATPFPASLLISPDGELKHDIVQELLRSRDNRPVLLEE